MRVFKPAFAEIVLKTFGWTMDGELPDIPKMVVIAAPHTSNWDLFFMLALSWRRRLHVHWMGKNSIFKKPFGPLMRSFGGIPIERSKTHGAVHQAVDAIKRADRIILTVPAEGTRGAVEYWKSGFFVIAEQADVPVVLGYLDYRHKRGGFGPAIDPKIGKRAMMDEIRTFYADKLAKYPDGFVTPKLRDENE